MPTHRPTPHLDLKVAPSARRQLQMMLDTAEDSGAIVAVLLGWRGERREDVLDLHVCTAEHAAEIYAQEQLRDEPRVFKCDGFTVYIVLDPEPFIGRELIYADDAFQFRRH